MTAGSAAVPALVPDYDDHVVTLLRRAGTISLGKTNTPEFGLPCYTEPDVAPPARTPWDLDRSAGGSSGGAGAAVAAGLVPFAHGSDGGGSVRIPSSVCGLFGIKVSRGRISNGPVLGDPHWAAPPAESFLAAADRDPGRLRIGRYRAPVIADSTVHPDCLAAWEDASALLAAAGHEVEDVPGPFGPDR